MAGYAEDNRVDSKTPGDRPHPFVNWAGTRLCNVVDCASDPWDDLEPRSVAEPSDLRAIWAHPIHTNAPGAHNETSADAPALEDFAMTCCESPDPALLEKNNRMFCRNCKRYLDNPPEPPPSGDEDDEWPKED